MEALPGHPRRLPVEALTADPRALEERPSLLPAMRGFSLAPYLGEERVAEVADGT